MRCRRQHLQAVEQRRYNRFTFVENTIGNLPNIRRAKFVGSNRLFCFISKCKFASFKKEDNTSRLLNRGGIADLPLLRTLLAICQKSQEPNFWEVKDSFVLLAYASLAASRTLLQQFRPSQLKVWSMFSMCIFKNMMNNYP